MAKDRSTPVSPSRVSETSRSPGIYPVGHETADLNPRSSTGALNNSKRQNGFPEDMNESSPLLSPVYHQDETRRSISATSLASLDWNDGDEEEASKSLFYLFILTLSVGGLQIAWAVEISAGSPYLLSLGISKSLLALVWIAGPLTGVLVQPYIGIRSDNCRISWGKRIPFMLGGAVATAVSFLALAWTREIVQGILGLFGAERESDAVKTCSIIVAVLFVYALDFSINAVQAAIRAFIVDNAPTHQQEAANAWAGRIVGVGNILGYICGYINLPMDLPWLGRTQFQGLCAIASLALCSTVAVSILYIRERDPRLEGTPAKNPGLISFFRQAFNSMRRLPPQIRKVCEAQFFNWLGWFGFLFYITTYIGQLELNPYFADHPDLSPQEVEEAWEGATRIGAFALLTFAIVSFSVNMLLPFFVRPSYTAKAPTHPTISPHHTSSGTPALSASIHSYFSTKSSAVSRSCARLTRLVSLLQIRWLSLRRAWLLSHFFFALCMASTFFISTSTAAITLAAFVGIPWAVSLWAPFALISAEISKRDTEARRNPQKRTESDGSTVAEREDQAGVILGLHNVAISAPQMLATLVSSIIFKLAQKPRGTPYDNSVGWVLRFGGLAALAAAYFTWRIGEERSTNDRGEVEDYRPVQEIGLGEDAEV